MKQETLEEAIEQYAEIYRCPATNKNEYCRHDIISAVKFGAKWQQEKSYSEEDMKEAFRIGFNLGCNAVESLTNEIAEEWFKNGLKKFKNK
jgi:hypothetical protein